DGIREHGGSVRSGSGVPPPARRAPQPRGASFRAGGQIASLRGGGVRGEAPEEGKASSQGSHGGHRPTPRRGRQLRVPIAREGWVFILPTLAVTGIAAAAGLWIAAAVLAAAAIFLIQFFRDPERSPEGGEDAIVSPADGTVLGITEAPEAPPGAR